MGWMARAMTCGDGASMPGRNRVGSEEDRCVDSHIGCCCSWSNHPQASRAQRLNAGIERWIHGEADGVRSVARLLAAVRAVVDAEHV